MVSGARSAKGGDGDLQGDWPPGDPDWEWGDTLVPVKVGAVKGGAYLSQCRGGAGVGLGVVWWVGGAWKRGRGVGGRGVALRTKDRLSGRPWFGTCGASGRGL